jgi:large-conductance mechanosensitive channel
MEYLHETIDTINEQFVGFFTFLFEKNIFQAGIAFVVATQINTLFMDFLSNIVTPIADKIVSKDINKVETTVIGVKLKTGSFIMSLINFFIVMFSLFYLYKISDSSKTLFENIVSKVKSIF